MADTPLSPHEQIMNLAVGYLFSAALRATVELGVADRLADGAKTPEALANELGVVAQPLARTLRLLASAGVFAEDDSGRFGLTPAADVLRADAPGSMRDAALMLNHEVLWVPAGQLATTIRTGETPFRQIFGQTFFDYLEDHPDSGATIHRGMAGFSDGENQPIVGAYDFGAFERVVDVGGGHGGFLVQVLTAHPAVTGVLFDAEHVLRDARIATAGLSDRCELVAGDFFDAVPQGDCLVVKRILHDWADEACVSILTSCRRAVRDGGRVLVVDAVVPPGNDPHPAKVIDLMMLASLPGRERTEAEFRALFEKSGLRLERIVPTPTMLSIVEAVVA